MSSLKERRWRRRGLNGKAEVPPWGELIFGKKLYGIRRMLAAIFACGFFAFTMLYQLEMYGYWEAKGAKVEGPVGYGIAYFFVAILLTLVVATINDWRKK